MSIQELGSLGELIAAIATVGTLIYLALQIKQSSRSVDAATEDGVVTRFNDINMLVGSNPELSALLVNGLEHPEELTETESLQFSWLYRCYINQYISLYQLYKKGVLSSERWAPYAREVAQWTATRGGAIWKDANPNMDDFWKEIEDVPVEGLTSLRMARDITRQPET